MTEQDKKYVIKALEYALHGCTDNNGNAETHYNTLANAIDVVKNCSIPNVGISLPERNSGEMWAFILVNALRCLNEEQRAGLCFDLYSRNKLTESIDDRIRKMKEERQ